MSDYLLGNYNSSVGMVNGIKVRLKTKDGVTVLTLGNETHTFQFRRDALEFLRRLSATKKDSK